jgi:hypothetical protein
MTISTICPAKYKGQAEQCTRRPLSRILLICAFRSEGPLPAHIVDRNGRVGAVMCSVMPRAVPSEGDLQTRRFAAVCRRVPHTSKYLLSRAKTRFL